MRYDHHLLINFALPSWPDPKDCGCEKVFVRTPWWVSLVSETFFPNSLTFYRTKFLLFFMNLSTTGIDSKANIGGRYHVRALRLQQVLVKPRRTKAVHLSQGGEACCPWLIFKSAHPPWPFDTLVTGMRKGSPPQIVDLGIWALPVGGGGVSMLARNF